MKMRLIGRTVLVTRAEHQADSLAHLIESEGGVPILFPTIQILPPGSWNECDSAIAGLDKYDGVIFTSANAVESFLDRLSSLQESTEVLSSKAIYSVGEKTESVLKSHGLRVDFLPEKFTAEDLAAAFTADQIAGKRFLFPRGNLGRDTIRNHFQGLGSEIDAVVVYRTEAPEQNNIDRVQKMLEAGTIDVVTFTSPSTLKNFFAAIPAFPAGAKDPLLAVIGPVTAAALEKAGRHADIVAAESTVEGLITAIVEYFQSNQS